MIRIVIADDHPVVRAGIRALLDGEDDLSRALEPADCPVVRLGVRKLLSRDAVRAAGRLRAFWRETRPDVVQTYFQDSSYFGVPVARAAGVKVVVRVRNNLGYALTRRDRVAGRVIRPFVSRFLTNTEAGRDAIVAGLPEGWEFDECENAHLVMAARQLEDLERLEDAIEADGVMVIGSKAQSVINPAIPEARPGGSPAGFWRIGGSE